MSKPLRALLVEDSEEDATLILMALSKAGYDLSSTRVETATALSTALEAQTWDVILCDYYLPHFNALHALKLVQARGLDLPFIVVSGAIGEDLAVAAMKAGAHDYLLKGSLMRLAPAIERELREAEMRRQRQRAEAALRESELRFRRLTESDIIGVIVAQRHRVTEANQLFLNMIGYTREELEQGKIDWEEITPAEYRILDEHALQELQSSSACQPFEKEFIRKDGSRVPILIGGSLLSKPPMTWLSFVLDLTRLKQSEQELQTANEELHLTNEELQTIGEELRTTNEELHVSNETLEQRVAQRTIELEQRNVQLRSLASELTRVEERERRRVAQILHDGLQQILVGARLNLESLCAQHKSKPFVKELHAVLDMLGESLKVSRSLTAELSPSILHHGGLVAALEWLSRWYKEKYSLRVQVKVDRPVDVDAEDLRITVFHAVRELLFNVVKHANVNTANVHVSRADNGTLEIVVSDKGVGFDPTLVRAKEGVAGAIGLFSLRERLELLGGALKIKSAPGRGSQFTLQFPLPAPDAGLPVNTTAPASPHKKAPIPELAFEGRKIRILLADDHAIVRDGLTRAFQDEPDLEVVGHAADGRQAVALAHRLQPDVVVMDISMPRLDGIGATRQLSGELPQIRVIGLSMFEDEAHTSSMQQAGAVACLHKTAPPSNLISAIRTHVALQNGVR